MAIIKQTKQYSTPDTGMVEISIEHKKKLTTSDHLFTWPDGTDVHMVDDDDSASFSVAALKGSTLTIYSKAVNFDNQCDTAEFDILINGQFFINCSCPKSTDKSPAFRTTINFE